MNEEVFEVFFRAKPAKILTVLKDDQIRYGAILAKKADCTYSHTVKVLDVLEKNKLVTFKREGRIKIVRLTKEGERIAEYIQKIRSV